jgi:hypothetical protein
MENENVLLVEVMKFKPTQSGLGMEEVHHKVKQIKAMSEHELKAYIDKKVVPVVLGPKKEYYLIDHHHYAYSMYLAGHKEVKAKVVADFSSMKPKDFWQEMMKKKWVWLYLPNGVQITADQIPTKITELQNDYFRSLSWGVREQKGFDESADKVPFFEFMWGSFFREHLTEHLISSDFELATHFGLKLSQHPLAQKLPGYLGKVK